MSRHNAKKAAEQTNPDFTLNSIGNYSFEKTLGEGNFAKVKLAKHKLTEQEVAIKVIDKTQLDEKKRIKLYREVRIMKSLHHPNIVRLYEVIETKYTVFLVMEYAAGGELYDYLVVHGRMKEKDARAKFRQIVSAVSYCHKKRVIHRDLKAENLLLDSNLDIKIADFGFSNYYDPASKLDTFCGSPPYAAPELFQGRRYTGPEVDVWSLGVILYVLTTGCLPFDGKTLQEMRESVCRGKYRVPFYLTDGCEKLLRKFLVRDPTKRPSLEFLIDDSWVNEGYDNSPVDSSDMNAKVEEDEELIEIVCTKFGFAKDVLLKSLREGIYDDIAAIYHIYYFERVSKAEGGRSRSLSATPDRRESNSSSVSASKEEKAKEEEATPTQLSPAAAAVTSSRRRRFTVNEMEMKKYIPDAVKPKDKEVPSILEEEKETEKKPPSTAPAMPPAQEPVSPTRPNIQTIPEAGPVEQFQNPSPAATEDGRRRTNTIVGIFRNPMRRLSVADPSAVAAAAAATTQQESAASRSTTSTTASEDGSKPRSLRFTFNSNSTSTKPPDEIVQEILKACAQHKMETKNVERYVISCSYNENTPKAVRFEVEVCKLPRLKNLHGLKFKRLSGASSDYKDACELILNTVSL